MCNIAGYVGSRQAAPILIDMMRRQEGWDCGHYTGMATLSGGKLYVKKDVGNMDMVFGNVDLSTLPGTIGFIHSRTPGSPGQENAAWAHPFIGNGGEFAYIQNGYPGAFAGTAVQERERAYKELTDAGYYFDTWENTCVGEKNRMPDGRYIHSTELKCQLVQKWMDEGMDPRKAAEKAAFSMPSEVVGLGLTVKEPDSILWWRINYPMFAGFADHGIYLATTPQAIPEDARNVTLLQPLSTGRVYRDRIETVPNTKTDITVAPITPGVWKACIEAMETALGEKQMHHDALDRLIRPLFSQATCPPESAVNYAIMTQFQNQGRLEITRTERPGTAPNSTAPKLYARLK